MEKIQILLNSMEITSKKEVVLGNCVNPFSLSLYNMLIYLTEDEELEEKERNHINKLITKLELGCSSICN